MVNKRLTTIAHDFIKPYLKEQGVFVDATLGNGHDTLFLLEASQGQGRVVAFDIQEEAIISSKDRLAKSQLDGTQVSFIHDSHSQIKTYIKEPIHVAVFNLGYLPGGDPAIITQAETTLAGLDQVLDLLIPGGLVSIMVYYGHPGGRQEKEAVQDYLSALDPKKYDVFTLTKDNRSQQPPVLHLIYSK